MFQFAGINTVILNRIRISKEFGMLKPRHRSHHFFLNIAWQATGQAIRINNIALGILWFEHHMVLLCICESDYFILN